MVQVIAMTIKKERLFSNKSLIRLLVPLVIEQGLSILVGMCDSVMVSSAGEAAISGVSLVDMINAIILTLFAALATGGTVITSQFLGARKQADAQKSAGQLVLLSAVMGLVCMTLCLVFARGFMRLFFGSIDADVMEAGLLYLRITAVSFPFIALYSAGAAIFRSIGNSKISMQVSILMNVINVVGNAICVLGLKMGVAGVAIPTLISRAVAAVVILALASSPKQELQLKKQYVFHIQGKLMRRILHIGIPSACENSFFQLGRAVVVSMIALFGTVQTSANAVAGVLDSLACIGGNAMSLAMVTVIGRCIGAGDMKQVTYYIKKMMLWAYILWALNSAPILLFCRQLIGCYSTLSPETAELSFTLVWIHNGIGILLWPASFVLPNALRAANDVKYTMWVGVISMLLARIALSWVLCVYFEMGAVGVWWAMVVDWVVRISFFLPRVIHGKWKEKCFLA